MSFKEKIKDLDLRSKAFLIAIIFALVMIFFGAITNNPSGSPTSEVVNRGDRFQVEPKVTGDKNSYKFERERRTAPSNPGKCTHSKDSFNCVVFVRNYDADTITFNIPNVHPLIGDGISVRIRGVDAPEMRGGLPCERDVAIQAKSFVFNRLKNSKNIRLVNVSKDKYFRILADVYVDGENLSQMLLDKGYAYPYFGGTKERLNWCLSR